MGIKTNVEINGVLYHAEFNECFPLVEIKAMREEFDKYVTESNGFRIILTASVSAENPQIRESYEISEISK